MRKIQKLLIVMAGLLFLLPSVNSEAAEYYRVQKGDCLSAIGVNLGIKWQKIARINNIQSPYVIYPEQKLSLQAETNEKSEQKEWRPYRRVGANPYQNTWQWALENFNLPENIKKKIRQNIQKDKFSWFDLAGQKIQQMVSGKNQILNRLICQWDKTHLYAAKDYGCDGYHYIFILKCGNWAWWQEDIKAKVKEVRKMESKPAKSKKLPPVPVFEPVEEREKVKFENEFDLYLGGGIYDSVHFSRTDGRYGWAKGRWRPIKLNLSKGMDLGLGFFGFGALGSGRDTDYNYDWDQWNLGLTAKLTGKSWDADFDYGLLGRLINKGDIGLYQSKQVDSLDLRYFSAHLNLYGRRDRGEKWFPKTELNFEGRWPRNLSHEHSWDGRYLEPNPYDNRNLELMLTQGIYDFEFGDNMMLTPGFNLGVGRAFGLEQDYYQLGPRIALTWHDQDIASLSFLNYKEMLGGDGDQWHWLSGWISVDGLVSAYKASRITQATTKDLEI